MSGLKTKDKDISVPGDILAEGMEYLPSYGTYRSGDKILAGKLGLVKIEGKVIKLVPLKGIYQPKRNDVVIGNISDILMSGWRVDFSGPYEAVLPLKEASSEFIERGTDLTHYFDIDDIVMVKITNVTSQKLVDVTARGPGLKKLKGGRLIDVNTHKVPRIIGKGGSMVSMIKNATGCKIFVGQNGRVWINSDDVKNEIIAIDAIRKVEEEAHLEGLTDRIKNMLEKQTGKKIEVPAMSNNQGDQK